MQNQIVPDIVDLQDLWDPYKIHCWDMILDHFKKEYNILFLYIYIYISIYGAYAQQRASRRFSGKRRGKEVRLVVVVVVVVAVAVFVNGVCCSCCW